MPSEMISDISELWLDERVCVLPYMCVGSHVGKDTKYRTSLAGVLISSPSPVVPTFPP